MASKGRILAAAAAVIFSVTPSASGQTQSFAELQDGISIRTARLEAVVKSLRPSTNEVLFNTSSINVKLLSGLSSVAWHSAGEAFATQNSHWIVTKSNTGLPPVPDFAHRIVPPMIPGAEGAWSTTQLALRNQQTEKPQTVPEVPPPNELTAGGHTPQTYIQVHNGRKYLKQELAVSGWRYIDPASLLQQPPPHPNDGVPPPAPAPEPVD